MADFTRHPAADVYAVLWRLPLFACLILMLEGAFSGAAGRDKGLTTIAVLDFKPQKVSRETAVGVSDSLTRHLSESGEFRLWIRPKVAEATASVVEDYRSGWICEEIECAVMVGKELRSNTVVIGSVSKFGRLVTVSAQAVDVNSQSVVGTWSEESLTGEEGVPAAVRDLAEQIVKAKGKLPRGEVTDRAQDTRPTQDAPFVRSEASFAIGAGLGIHGHETASARLRWLGEIGLWGRRGETRLTIGLRAGAASMSSVRTNVGDDTGFKFHIYGQLGVIFYETRRARAITFSGIGYRDYKDEPAADNSFLVAGLSMRFFSARTDLTYWHGLKSYARLRDMVTVSLGIGTGF